MIAKYEVTPKTARAINKLYKEAIGSARTVFEDEDTVTFTRAELVAIWEYILGTNTELSERRLADPEYAGNFVS